MNSTVAPGAPGVDEPGKCELLGPFAVLVQAALGALALLSLVYKRWRERPQRPVKIWAFDASKQVFGSVLLHLANLFMSMLSAGEIQAQIAKAAAHTLGAAHGDDDYKPNPCSFYLLNLGIDTTLGIPILILILKVLTIGASKTPLANPPESIQSGHYGTPPKWTWWLKQSMLYFIGLLLMKACVFFIFELAPWIIIVGDWALRWTEGNEALQIAFVMLIFPLIMNAMQYYIIDTFIKNRPQEDGDDGRSEHGSEEALLANEDRHGDSIDEDVACKNSVGIQTKPVPNRDITPYDPVKDGEVPAALTDEAGGSGSSSTAGSGGQVSRKRSPSPDEQGFQV